MEESDETNRGPFRLQANAVVADPNPIAIPGALQTTERSDLLKVGCRLYFTDFLRKPRQQSPVPDSAEIALEGGAKRRLDSLW